MKCILDDVHSKYKKVGRKCTSSQTLHFCENVHLIIFVETSKNVSVSSARAEKQLGY